MAWVSSGALHQAHYFCRHAHVREGPGPPVSPRVCACPRCRSAQVQRWGRERTGTQRYRCLGCRRTFNDLTRTAMPSRTCRRSGGRTRTRCGTGSRRGRRPSGSAWSTRPRGVGGTR
ncbi:transposase [Gemmatimonas sp.]|uniref:transposase n=1 Tax=Gemmatimonas sp. TaxID=1962908 RepID=UPI003983AE33